MKNNFKTLILFIALILSASNAFAQTTAFTYQGKLTDGSVPANGTYPMQFDLFAAPTGGTPVATDSESVSVINGIFTVILDFGAAAFDGNARWLEITVNTTMLTPRQPLTSAPYSIRSLNAGTADTATTATIASNFTGSLSGDVLGTQGATVVSTVGGQSAVNVASATQVVNTATSANTPNTLVKRDANGDFSANIINATTQYNIGGNRVLTAPVTSNIFVGVNAGNLTMTGTSNSFVGFQAGPFSTTGNGNSFFGRDAGLSNTTGFGNSFVGMSAGQANTEGFNNSFVGRDTGLLNSTGNSNSFFGMGAGQLNTTGSNNTIVGRFANVGSGALTNATALGAGAIVNDSNTVVLGRSAGEDNLRSSGLTRSGNETGTAQVPSISNGGVYTGLVTRRIIGTITAVGTVVARSEVLRLERDGTNGGWRIANDALSSFPSAVHCLGTAAGAVIAARVVLSGFAGPGTSVLFTNAQNVEYMQCSFGSPFANGHSTQVTLQRQPGDSFWNGTVTSTINQ